jgi:hypothetical protein
LRDPANPGQRIKVAVLLLACAVLADLVVQRIRPPVVRLRLTDFVAPDRASLYSVPTLVWEDSVAAACSREARLPPKPQRRIDVLIDSLDLINGVRSARSIQQWDLALGTIAPAIAAARIHISPAGRIGPFRVSRSQTLVLVRDTVSHAPLGVWEVPFHSGYSGEQSLTEDQFRRPCGAWYRRVGEAQ